MSYREICIDGSTWMEWVACTKKQEEEELKYLTSKTILECPICGVPLLVESEGYIDEQGYIRAKTNTNGAKRPRLKINNPLNGSLLCNNCANMVEGAFLKRNGEE